MSQPCLNSGTCFANKTFEWGYNCQCPWGYNGTNCENDQRPCEPLNCFYPRGQN
jgi:Notch-like protein